MTVTIEVNLIKIDSKAQGTKKAYLLIGEGNETWKEGLKTFENTKTKHQLNQISLKSTIDIAHF